MNDIAQPAERVKVKPLADYGFFGPDSIAWRVWSYPTSLTIGLLRAVPIEEIHPFLYAGIAQGGGTKYRTRNRYERTVLYFGTSVFGDSVSAIRAASSVIKVHQRIEGTEPISGLPYRANDPETQLWILVTAWHSILTAYETLGPGPLSEEEASQYWSECAIAAELQTCDPASVPRSRAEVREYFERIRPRLAVTPGARELFLDLLGADFFLPPLPGSLRVATSLLRSVFRAGAVATMPHWIRRLVGIRQSRLGSAAAIAILKPTFSSLNSARRNRPGIYVRALESVAPSLVPVVAPMLYGIAPRDTLITTPSAAWRDNGFPTPVEADRQLRERYRKNPQSKAADVRQAHAELGPVQ